MGRYAMFSTGVEYKFTLAVQPSADIQEFGGITTCSAPHWLQQWTVGHDLALCRERVQSLAEQLGIELPVWTHYVPTRSGTTQLYADLDSMWYKTVAPVAPAQEATFRQWVLGCLIVHQLGYRPHLCAQFDL